MLTIIKGVAPPRGVPVPSFLERRPTWPDEVTDADMDWLNQQWQLAGGRPALTRREQQAMAGYFTWVTTEPVR